MMFFSIGLPSRFSTWCDSALTHLVDRGLGPVEILPAELPDAVAIALIRLRAPHLTIPSRYPTASLCAALAEAETPMIVALIDPRLALYELVAEQGFDIRTATRAVARSCAAVRACAALPRAVTVSSQHPLPDLVELIAVGCGLPFDTGHLAEVLAVAGQPGDGRLVEGWWAGLDPAERAVAEGAVGSYGEWFHGGGPGRIVWDRSLFSMIADPAQDAARPIEFGSDPAWLVRGPDIGLPPGEWAAAVTLAVSKEAVGAAFDVEVRAMETGACLARTHVVADGRGMGSTTLIFDIPAPAAQTIWLVIASNAPTPGGRLALGNVTLSPNRDDSADIPAELTMLRL